MLVGVSDGNGEKNDRLKQKEGCHCLEIDFYWIGLGGSSVEGMSDKSIVIFDLRIRMDGSALYWGEERKKED
jgi:hypothetical protein